MASFAENFKPFRMLIDNISSNVKTISEGVGGWFKATATQVPYEIQQAQLNDYEDIKASGVIERGLKVGAPAPDFTLPNQNGEQVSLNKLLEEGPVILTFYRGRWCPYCNIELRALQRQLEEFKSHGATLVAISPQSVEQTKEFAGEAPLTFEVLADTGNEVAKQYGLVYQVGNNANVIFNAFGINLQEFNDGKSEEELPIPATMIVSKERKVVFSFIDPDYTKRAEPAELISVLKSLN